MCFTSCKGSTIAWSKAWVARHGVQKADENCTIVARDPSSSPTMADVIMWSDISLLLRIAPRELLYQKPYPLAKTRTITSGMKDFTGEFSHNGDCVATDQYKYEAVLKFYQRAILQHTVKILPLGASDLSIKPTAAPFEPSWIINS